MKIYDDSDLPQKQHRSEPTWRSVLGRLKPDLYHIPDSRAHSVRNRCVPLFFRIEEMEAEVGSRLACGIL